MECLLLTLGLYLSCILSPDDSYKELVYKIEATGGAERAASVAFLNEEYKLENFGVIDAPDPKDLTIKEKIEVLSHNGRAKVIKQIDTFKEESLKKIPSDNNYLNWFIGVVLVVLLWYFGSLREKIKQKG